MTQLKLQVGKSYLNRKGDVRNIVKSARIGPYTFLDGKGISYTRHGRFHYNTPNELDLIKEVASTFENSGQKTIREFVDKIWGTEGMSDNSLSEFTISLSSAIGMIETYCKRYNNEELK